MDKEEAVEHADHHVMEHDVEPIPVVVIAPEKPHTSAADKASLQTYQLRNGGGTAVGEQLRILAQQPKRHKAQIIVNGSAGDYIIVGRQRQASNGQGGRIYAGTGPIPIESESALYINGYVSAANDIFVTVIEELYVG